MFVQFAADALVVLHLAFILFVILGGLLVFKWRKAILIHLPCVLWSVLLEFNGWICPLTPFEIHFREAAGEAGYTGGFIAHYLLPIIYPAGLTQNVQIILGILVILINLVIYGLFLAKRGAKRNADE